MDSYLLPLFANVTDVVLVRDLGGVVLIPALIVAAAIIIGAIIIRTGSSRK
jgi:hypothetical protein